MKHKSALVRLISILIFIADGMLFQAATSRAAETKEDYWYVETLTVSKVALPEGVEIIPSDANSQPRGYLLLRNETDTPLYVMSLRYKEVLVMVTPDPDWKSRVSAAHEAASYLVAPERPAHLTIEALVDLDPSLADRNVLSSVPPDKNLPIPASQKSELLMVYSGQVIEVPFTLSYRLNSSFDNGSQRYQTYITGIQSGGETGASETQQVPGSLIRAIRNNPIVIGVAVAAFLLITGWLAWRALKQPR